MVLREQGGTGGGVEVEVARYGACASRRKTQVAHLAAFQPLGCGQVTGWWTGFCLQGAGRQRMATAGVGAGVQLGREVRRVRERAAR